MEKGRTNLRQIAALATVVRGIVDGIKANGHPVVVAQYAALDAVDAFVRGEKLTKKNAERLSKAAGAEVQRFGVASPPAQKAAYWVSSPIGRLLTMAVRGEDDTTETLTYASYALGSLHGLPPREYDKRTKDAYAKALEAHARVSDAPLGERPKRVNRERVSLENDLLARSRRLLPPYARVLLDRLGAARDAKRVGTRAELLAALAKHGLPVHDSVTRFDEEFGGLLLRTEPEEGWREKRYYATVGAHACLTSQGSRLPQKGLVPVMYDSHGGVEYLDESGRAFIIDEIEEVLTPFAPDGATMLAAIIAFDLLEGHGEPAKGYATKPTRVGNVLAKALGLTRVPVRGSGGLWVSDDVVVAEAQGTRIAAWSDEAWKKIETILTGPKRSAADLFAELGGWDKYEALGRAFAALVTEIAGCTTFADLEDLFRPASVEYPTLQGALEQVDGQWRQRVPFDDGQRQVSAALMNRLPAMSVEESAKTLGWLAMAGGARWAGLRAWTNEGQRRRAWCSSIEAEMPLLLAWTKDAAACRRTSAAYALGFCANAGEVEADALLSALRAEEDTGARGTELLAIAAIARRSGARMEETKNVFVEEATKAPKAGSFHEVALIAARVFLDVPLSVDEAEALLNQLRRSAKPPPEWAWRSSDGPTKCDRIAADAMSTMTLCDPAPVIRALREALQDPKLAKRTQELKRALARATFAGAGKETPRQGIALEDLSRDEIAILEVLLAKERYTGEVFDLQSTALAEMRVEKPLDWQLIEVMRTGRKHRWHFERVVGEVVFGGLTVEQARDAVLEAFSAHDAALLASSWSHPRMALLKRLSNAEERGRVVKTCLAVLAAAKQTGVDVDALCIGAPERPLAEEGILALWSLAEHEPHPPREHFALYERARARPEWPEALSHAFARLPEAVLKAIEAEPPSE